MLGLVDLLLKLLGSEQQIAVVPRSQPSYTDAYRRALEEFLDSCKRCSGETASEKPVPFNTLVVYVKSGDPSKIFEGLAPVSSAPWYFVDSPTKIEDIELKLMMTADEANACLRIGRGELTCKRREGDVFVNYPISEIVKNGAHRFSAHYRFSALPDAASYYDYPPAKKSISGDIEAIAA